MPGPAWILVAYVFIVGTFDISSIPAWGHFKTAGAWVKLNKFVDGWYPPSARWLNANATMMIPNQLFTSRHIMGTNAFRVVVTMPDGSKQEPVQVFTADRKGGADTQGVACTRHYQSMIYVVGAFLSHDRYPPNSGQILDDFMIHAMRKVGGRSASLVISPLDKPLNGWKEIRTVKAAPPDREPRPDLFAVGALALPQLTAAAWAGIVNKVSVPLLLSAPMLYTGP
jgi:hypothetical protein